MFFPIDFDAMLNERLAEVAEFTPEQADALDFGATTVIGILSNASGSLMEKGLSPDGEAAIVALFDAAQVHVDLLHDATIAAQVAEVEVEDEDYEEEEARMADLAEWEKELLGITDEDEDEDDEPTPAEVKAIDDLVEGLFAMMIGPEAAAAVRAEVEAKREPQPEDEFDKFLRDLLAQNA